MAAILTSARDSHQTMRLFLAGACLCLSMGLDCGVGAAVADSFDAAGHRSMIWSAAFSVDGKRVVTASADHTAIVWEVATGKQLGVLKGHHDSVLAVAFSPDDRLILTGSGDDLAILWDSKTFAMVHTLRSEGRSCPVEAVAFRQFPKLQAITGSFGHLAFWDVGTGKQTHAIDPEDLARVNSIVLDKSETKLLLGEPDGLILWDAEKDRCIFKDSDLKGMYSCSGIAMARHGQYAAAAACDKAIIWDLEREVKREIPAPKDFLFCVAAAPNGLQMAFGQDGRIMIWDIPRWLPVASMDDGDGCVDCLAFSPDGRTLLSAAGNDAKLWDVVSGRLLQTYPPRAASLGRLDGSEHREANGESGVVRELAPANRGKE